MIIANVVERVVAWFMSWAVWNPEFVRITIKNIVHTFKNSFQDIVAFWKECYQMASGSTWISLLVVVVALIVLLFEIILIIGCAIVSSPILLLYLTPLGVCSTCLVVKAIKNDTFRKTRRFFRRVSWAFRTTWKEENTKKRKEKKKKQFRVIEGGRKAS